MTTTAFLIFTLVIVVLLALDLGVLHRNSRSVKFREALAWSAVWISLSMLFAVGVYLYWPPGDAYTPRQAALTYLTGYITELSLSVDNLFVFLLVMGYFRVPEQYQHKVLFWGILGAIVMRAIFILAGTTLIHMFTWLIYVFGAILVISGIKLFRSANEDPIDPGKNPVLRWLRSCMRVTDDYVDGRFIVRIDGKAHATPLMVVLIFIEIMDLTFAVDSIPAIIGITQNTFIIYTSNVFAILGLRSMYFALAGVMHLFRFLSYGLASVLIFIGAKMLLHDQYKVPVEISLSIVGALLAISVIASLMFPEPREAPAAAEPTEPPQGETVAVAERSE